ncbi:MMPL family transporter [Geomonas sp. Red32]|uniref:MMPL family transporter n=1 Tax=Geomonas sp. Red32 TaxID=2912856 RepID=UPI00202CEEA4|nr:MMPL family transporter [Geomonas sp. Red32]MCM0081478.1 MMPL family transporter [Geomonas sp. Red32]
MFPQSGPLSLFIDIMRWTGSSGNTYFLLEGDKEQVIQEAAVFARKLKELKVDGAPAFTKVKYTVSDPSELQPLTGFLSYAVCHPQLFVAPADVASYLELLSAGGIESSLRKATVELATPGAFSGLIRVDPLYLRNLILPRLKAASESLAFDPSSPYFLSRDGRVLVMIARPARPVTDLDFARNLVAGIDAARRGSPVAITCAGAHLSAVTDEAEMKKNVVEGVIFSLAIVLGLFYAVYRRFLPTLLIPVILVFGVVVAVAVGGVIYRSMSVISFAFASLIVGIGTDYSIHLYDRFHFERFSGCSLEEAVRLAVVDTGHALFTAATTTAIPFIALAFSGVRVLAELGLLVGLGVVFSMYATLFFLPPLLVFMEKRHPLKVYRPLPAFGLRYVWKLANRHPRKLVFGCVVVAVSLLACATRIKFEGELKNLQPKSSEAFRTQEKLEKHLAISPKEMIVAVEGKDLAQVVSGGGKVVTLAGRYKRKGELVAYGSLLDVINGSGSEEKVIAALRRSPETREVAARLERALAQEGFAVEAFLPYVRSLATLHNPPVTSFAEGVQHLSDSPFRGIMDRYLAHDPAGYHLLTHLDYRGSEFNRGQFLNELQREVPQARATGIDLVSEQLTASVKETFVWAVIWGLGMVLVLLLMHFNSLPGILYSLFPLVSGVIAMLGVMAVTGSALNFMNVMVLVTILGMGSDCGLHIGHRVRNCRHEEYQERFVQSARAVLLSAFTTIAGFGSLALTDYAAMASIGSATNIGVIATTLFTLAAVPSLISLVSTPRRRRD